MTAYTKQLPSRATPLDITGQRKDQDGNLKMTSFAEIIRVGDR